MDTVAWNRVLMLIDGIDPKTAQEMFDWIRLAKNPYKLDLSDTVNKVYLKQLKDLSALLLGIYNNPENVSDTIDKNSRLLQKLLSKEI